MRIVALPVGSSGDVHPFLGLALALRARGHELTIATSGYFENLVRRTGLEFVEIGTREEFLAVADHPDIWHPRRAFGHLFRAGAEHVLRGQYALVAARAASGPIVVLHNCLGLGARVARDRLGIPLVTIHCQPATLWSEYESPVIPGMWARPEVPRWIKRFQYWIGETFVIDRLTRPVLDAFRREVGLAPVRKTTRWWHTPDGVLCLFPEWFARRQPDWPENVEFAPFPLWDEAEVTAPQPEVEAFLGAGDAPIVFTPGSANKHARPFFGAALDACRRLGRRGVFLSRFPEQIPDPLPDGVRHFDYVPLGRLLSRAAALVHHGGIGTAAQGLRAGIPQLVMPMAYDQPDNAARLAALGVGDSLPPAEFRGAAVANRLARLLASAEVRRACLVVAGRFAGGAPFEQACHAIESIGARYGDRASSPDFAASAAPPVADRGNRRVPFAR